MALLVFQGPQTPPISFRYWSHIIQLSYSFALSFARSANAKSTEIYIKCERYKTLTTFSLSSIFLGSHKVLKPFLFTSPVDPHMTSHIFKVLSLDGETKQKYRACDVINGQSLQYVKYHSK